MNKEIGKKWLKQALHDLEIAEKNIDIEGYDVAAFLAHQSVEKLLKSIFGFQGKKIPKIHYIDELGQKLGISDDILEDIFDLTSDYMFSRYPDMSDKVPYEQYNENIAKGKVEKAKRIFKALEDKYNEEINNDKKDKISNGIKNGKK